MKLYHFPLSGHSHRVRLFLSLLGVPCEEVLVDLAAGAHKREDFLRMNAFGQVPVLEDQGQFIADSNAILVYLAKKFGRSDWLPEEAMAAATVQRWLSVAAGELAYGPAASRLITLFGARLNPEETIARAHLLFGRMEAEFRRQPFLAGERATLADVALYSYTARAPEGNVDLAPYPGIRAWLARIEALPGFLPFVASPVGLAATA